MVRYTTESRATLDKEIEPRKETFKMTNPLMTMFAKTLTEQALSYGAKRMASQKPDENDVFTNISNIVSGFTQKDQKPSKAQAETEKALTRLSGIASSLEESDSHQMIADIMTLVRESKNLNDETKMKWIAALYGGPAS